MIDSRDNPNIHFLAMSHYKNNRGTQFYKLYKAVERDRRLTYDYRIKERSYEKPALFRRKNGYLQCDYRHEVSVLCDTTCDHVPFSLRI